MIEHPTEWPGAAKSTLTRKVGPLPIWGWVAVIAGGIGAYILISKRTGSSTTAATTNPVAAAVASGTAGNYGGDGGSSSSGGGGGGVVASPSPTPTPVSGGGVGSAPGGTSDGGAPGGVLPNSNLDVAGMNAYWNGILDKINAMPGTAKVAPLFPASTQVLNTASPEAGMTADQYKALVLNLAPGSGATTVDVSKAATTQQNQAYVDYLRSIIKTGTYNPDVAMISNQARTQSMIDSVLAGNPSLK